MELNLEHFWNSNTPAPPKNEIIGKYEIRSQLTPPTNYSYIYLGNKIENDKKKVFKFIKCKRSIMYRIINEIVIMNELDHPNIIKMEDYFQYKEYICIVTDYKPLSSLHSFIIKEYPNGIPERKCKQMFKKMLEAVKYLHEMNIWHRDVKPDNFLIEDSNPENPKILLTDFGFARRFNQDELSEEYIGTPEFCPPEMYNAIPYNNKVDIYSLGVTLFVMLTARYPVPSAKNAPSRCKELIRKGRLNYQLLDQKFISSEAIDLIKSMCTLDYTDRMTANEALDHPWFNSISKSNEITNKTHSGSSSVNEIIVY
ncbi:hypothetical protein M9Y10_006185 [Tritrichomonas musculus]|uniref:Protein kinase domain-containing protein n=1 Tax=Tritrichomonas musculus TaxID=1915356 RepID=A0ABR2JEH8_9EUKA